MKGNIKGLTFTGNPWLTTLGNTLKMCYYLEYVCHLAQIPEKMFKLSVAGDDVLMMMESSQLRYFTHCFFFVFTPLEPVQTLHYGLGQRCQFVDIRKESFSFLSKMGCVLDNGTIKIHRRIDRLTMGSNYSSNLSEKYTSSNHAWATTNNILHAAGFLSGIRDVVKYRNLFPSKRPGLRIGKRKADKWSNLAHANDEVTYEEALQLEVRLADTPYFVLRDYCNDADDNALLKHVEYIDRIECSIDSVSTHFLSLSENKMENKTENYPIANKNRARPNLQRRQEMRLNAIAKKT